MNTLAIRRLTLLIVKVPPAMSSIVNLLSRAYYDMLETRLMIEIDQIHLLP